MESILKSNYEELPLQAIEDIKPLCRHIIKHFDIKLRTINEVFLEHIKDKQEKIVFHRSKDELHTNELLIYTLGKLGRFRFVNLRTFIEEDIFEKPPTFAWRFSNFIDEDYDELIKCIDSFKGELKWIMYKFKYGKNYIISPLTVYEIEETVDRVNISDVLRREHPELPYLAIKDIEPLCEHLEKCFNLADKEPYYMKDIREGK